MSGHINIQRARCMAVFQGPDNQLALRMAVSPGMHARLRASKALSLLPHSAFMDA